MQTTANEITFLRIATYLRLLNTKAQMRFKTMSKNDRQPVFPSAFEHHSILEDFLLSLIILFAKRFSIFSGISIAKHQNKSKVSC
jgi:type II secretory pathway component PulF